MYTQTLRHTQAYPHTEINHACHLMHTETSQSLPVQTLPPLLCGSWLLSSNCINHSFDLTYTTLTYTPTHMPTHVCTDTHSHVSVHIHTHTHTHIRTRTHAPTHTHTHTHTHTPGAHTLSLTTHTQVNTQNDCSPLTHTHTQRHTLTHVCTQCHSG